jgi:hypothetical protein
MGSTREARSRLQQAVKAGDYIEAEQRLGEYVRAVNALLTESGPLAPRALETVREALELLQWADRAVRAGRARDAADLARLSASRPYRAAAPRRPVLLEATG